MQDARTNFKKRSTFQQFCNVQTSIIRSFYVYMYACMKKERERKREERGNETSRCDKRIQTFIKTPQNMRLSVCSLQKTCICNSVVIRDLTGRERIKPDELGALNNVQNEPQAGKPVRTGLFYSTSAGFNRKKMCWRVKENLQGGTGNNANGPRTEP